MKKSWLLAGMLAGSVVLTGCATAVRELPAEVRKSEPQGAEYEFCRQLVIAFMKNDAKAFLARIPEEARSKFNEKQFAASRKSVLESMGEPISFQYVTALELDDEYVRISSWGRCYYIKISEYTDYVNRNSSFLISNLVLIRQIKTTG